MPPTDVADDTARPATVAATARRRRAFRVAVRTYAGRAWADRRLAVPALVLPGLGNILVAFCPPLVVAALLERFQAGQRPTIGELAPYLAAFGGAWFAGEVLWRFGVHFVNRLAADGAATLHTQGMHDLLGQDLAFFHDNFAGALTKKVTSYGSSYEQVVDVFCFRIGPHLLPAGFISVVLWRYSPWLVVALFGMVALTGLAVTPLILRRQALVDAREAASNHLAAHVADAVGNMDAIRLFSREPEESATHRRNVRRWRDLAVRSWDYQNRRIDVLTAPLYNATNLLGVVLAVLLSEGGRFDLAAVFVTFTYYAHFTQVVWELNDIYRTMETHLSAAAQFTELFLDPPTVLDAAEPVPLAPRDSAVELRNVWFTHANRSDALFEGLNLRIGAGEKVGLVGRSGGGKTTLTRLLLRLADVDAGTIAVGGQDIARLRQADLRSLIAYVPQDPVMFHRSLWDNIAFGRLDATDAQVRAAAEAAHAAGFIGALPEGYATLVGERGIKLSGGQRQRLAIARAVLRDAPILVLDEATSSLDSDSEALIQHALLTLMRDRTAIVIAHRLSTVRVMDRLIVLEGGAVAEEGTHDQLLAAGGVYAGLWAKQSGGFLVEAG